VKFLNQQAHCFKKEIWFQENWIGRSTLWSKTSKKFKKLPSNVPIPTHLWLGAAGLNGMTAYAGLIEVGKLKEGETVLVSGAAGATGSVAGQIAKIYSCRVVGTAGSDEKCKFLKEECGFDEAINYNKATDLLAAVSAACPGGIDLFFDNVGGQILEVALDLIKDHARIVVCGSISQYEIEHKDRVGPKNYMKLVRMNASMTGFMLPSYVAKFPEMTQKLIQWVLEKKIVARVQILEGVEKAPDALIMLFKGDNIGKVVVKVA